MRTITLTQEELEQKAIDSMIAHVRSLIAEQEMGEAINNALQYYADIEGHRSIVLKKWIIETIYALDKVQLERLDRIAFKYLHN